MTAVKNYKLRKRGMHPARVIALGFIVIVLVGALLLSLPVSNADGQRESFLTCLFTSTSATCVTGLMLVDTASHWSTFGQAVILLMIQIGGLGFMTMAVILSMLIKRSISPRERQVIAQSLSLSSFSGMIKLSKKIIKGTAAFEVCGAAILMTRFVPLFGFGSGIWKSIFTSVSAFCNAGFDLMGAFSGKFSSLTYFCDDPVVCFTVMILIVTGGIGFIVWDDFYKRIFEKKRFFVYSRFVILATVLLIIGGTAAILAIEWSNPETLGSMTFGQKILAALFQSVTTRTAGFNTVSLDGLRPVTKLIMILLMFIGGCSGSTAGGIKVSTFAIVIWTVICVLCRKSDIVVFKRRITEQSILRAFSILVLQFIITIIGAFVIIGGGADVMSAMFEAFSASATVGLTLSLTPLLGTAGKIAVIVLMYFGRVGILTASCAVMIRLSGAQPEYKNADANMLVG